MLRLILALVFLDSCFGYGMLGAPTCKFVFPRPDENNEVSTTVCAYDNYVISNNATFWSPKPDCNRCICKNGVLHCCLYGIKANPIPVPVWCEIQTIGETCQYKLVSKADNNTECTF